MSSFTEDAPEIEGVSIDDIMASLGKETRSKVRFGNDFKKKFFPTASYGLNRELGGGLYAGKQHTFWGGEGAGKSGFLMQTIGINQKRGVPCAWIDAEGIYDPEWAARLGIDTSKLIVSNVGSIAEATDLQVELIKLGVEIIVIDSTAALFPKSFIDKNGELKPFSETGQLGQVAKDLGQMCNTVQGINYTAAICHISQQRVDVGSPAMTKPYKPVGGKQVEHTDALRVRLVGTKSDAKMIKEKVQRGNNLVEEVVGFPVNWIINKNRLNGRAGNGDYDFIKVGDNPGVCYEGEVLDIATNYGYVDRGGAWYTIFEERCQGRAAAIKYLKENPAVLEKLEKEIEQSI